MDGTFPRAMGVISERFGTPVRVNLLSGVVATVFSIVAINLAGGDSATTFEIVLTIAISTVLLSYLIIYPSAVRLRRRYPDTPRPFRVPGGEAGLWACTVLATGFIALGSWAAVLPGTLEALLGVDYDFADTWGVSRGHFEALALGTLAVIALIAVTGYLLGARERRAREDALLAEGAEPQRVGELPERRNAVRGTPCAPGAHGEPQGRKAQAATARSRRSLITPIWMRVLRLR